LLYNIFNPLNKTLVYDTTVSQTLIASLIDDSKYTIDVSTKNFKYYNFITSNYEKYNTICISTNGWLGFISNILEYSNGTNTNLPINTLRFFSFDARSTINYYFDNSDNLFISTIGSYWADPNNGKFNIFIKISPIGIISVYYKSIGPNTRTPIIGLIGNDSGATTDDTFYKTFNGVQPFNQTNIDGQFLIFDMTGLSSLMMNSNDTFIATDNSKYILSEITNIRNTLKSTMETTVVYNNLTNSLLTNVELFYLGSVTPSITNFPNITKTFGSSPFLIVNPDSTSDGSFTYTSSNLGVATVSGSKITIVAAGTVTITVTQASTSNYLSGIKTLVLTVTNSTSINPTNINEGNELLYVMQTSAEYVNILGSIEISNRLISSTTAKILYTTNIEPVKITLKLK
jgi:hypothetical protein